MRKTLLQTLLAAFCAILCVTHSLGGGGMTRRDFGRGLAAIFATGVAPHIADAAIRRSMLAARAVATGGENIELCPDGIVRSGLIAYWDAKQNAGFGLHDASVRCVDLVGNCGTLSGFNSMAVDSMRFVNSTNCKIENADEIVLAFRNEISIEFVFNSNYGSLQSSQWAAFMTNVDSGVYFRTRSSTSSLQAIPGINISHALPANSFTYILKSDGTSKLFIDGSDVVYGTRVVMPYSVTGNFFVGSSGGATTNYLVGSVHSIRIYNRAISDEVRAMNRDVDISKYVIS